MSEKSLPTGLDIPALERAHLEYRAGESSDAAVKFMADSMNAYPFREPADIVDDRPKIKRSGMTIAPGLRAPKEIVKIMVIVSRVLKTLGLLGVAILLAIVGYLAMAENHFVGVGACVILLWPLGTVIDIWRRRERRHD